MSTLDTISTLVTHSASVNDGYNPVFRSVKCRLIHLLGCPCLFSSPSPASRSRVRRLLEDYRRQLHHLADDGQFDRDDFTVEVLPVLEGLLPQVYYRGRRQPDRFTYCDLK